MPGFQPLTSLFGEKLSADKPQDDSDSVDFDAILDPLKLDASGTPKSNSEPKKRTSRHKGDSAPTRQKRSTSRTPRGKSRTERSSSQPALSTKSVGDDSTTIALEDVSDDIVVHKKRDASMSPNVASNTADMDLGDSFSTLLEGFAVGPTPTRPSSSSPQSGERPGGMRVKRSSDTSQSPPSPSPPKPTDGRHRLSLDVSSDGGDSPVSRGEKLSSKLTHETSATGPENGQQSTLDAFDDDDIDALLPVDRQGEERNVPLWKSEERRTPAESISHTLSFDSTAGSEYETIKTVSDYAPTPIGGIDRGRSLKSSPQPSPVEDTVSAPNNADAQINVPSFLHTTSTRPRPRRRLVGSRRRPKQASEQDSDHDSDFLLGNPTPKEKVSDPFALAESKFSDRHSHLDRANTESDVIRQQRHIGRGDDIVFSTPNSAAFSVASSSQAENGIDTAPSMVLPRVVPSPVVANARHADFRHNEPAIVRDDETPAQAAGRHMLSNSASLSAAGQPVVTNEEAAIAQSSLASPSSIEAPPPFALDTLNSKEARNEDTPSASEVTSLIKVTDSSTRKLPIWMMEADPGSAPSIAHPAPHSSHVGDIVLQESLKSDVGKFSSIPTLETMHPLDDHSALPSSHVEEVRKQHSPVHAPLAGNSDVVDSLRETIEALRKQVTAAVSAQEQAARDMKAVKEAAAKADEIREEQHRGNLEALRSVHQEELESMRRRLADADRLAAAEAKLESAVSSFANLQMHISDRAKGLDAAHDAQLDARKRLVDDLELSAREARRQSESETVKLQGLLSSMDSVMRSIRSVSAHEHERLHTEQARLSSLQDALQSQAAASREALAIESANLRARVTTQEATMAKHQDDIAAERASIKIEREELEATKSEFERRKHRAEQEIDVKARSLAKKEEALRKLQAQVEKQSADLDRRVEAARALMLDADARDADLESREQKLQGEMRRLLDMHVDLEQATRVVAERHSQLDAAFQEAARVRAAGERSQSEIAVRQAELADTQAALAEEAKRRHVENVKLVRERTELLKAKSGVHRIQRQWFSVSPAIGNATHEGERCLGGSAPRRSLLKGDTQHDSMFSEQQSRSTVSVECASDAKNATGSQRGAGSVVLDKVEQNAALEIASPVFLSSLKADFEAGLVKGVSWKAELDRLRAAAARSKAAAKEQGNFLSEVGCVRVR